MLLEEPRGLQGLLLVGKRKHHYGIEGTDADDQKPPEQQSDQKVGTSVATTALPIVFPDAYDHSNPDDVFTCIDTDGSGGLNYHEVPTCCMMQQLQQQFPLHVGSATPERTRVASRDLLVKSLFEEPLCLMWLRSEF
eukprot:4970048-Amphidinium_carterae.1